jgi:Tfp pilus assembly protein PilN
MSELNLLPPYLKKKRQQKINIRNYILIGILGLCFILFLIYIPISGLLKVKSEELKYKTQAEQTNGDAINMENENIKKEIDNYKQYIEKVQLLTQKKVIVSNKIHELEQYVPVDIVFDSLAYGENGLTINATASSIDSISEFTANIQKSSSYKNVRVSNIRMENQTDTSNNTQNNEVYKFTINAVE